MKYKLPEGFKISRQEGYSHLVISDLTRNVGQVWSNSLKNALIQIDKYLNLLKEIEELELPENYKISIEGITDRVVLTYNDEYVLSDNNTDLKKLVREATKTTDLDLQIQALNNGEEIEL